MVGVSQAVDRRRRPVRCQRLAAGGWVPSVWPRGFGQQVSNHYQAFADPRADGSIAGIQSGFDLWRGALFPWGRDAAGLFSPTATPITLNLNA